MIFQIMQNGNKFLFVVLPIFLPKTLVCSLALGLRQVMKAHEYTVWRCCALSRGISFKKQVLEVIEKSLK